MSRLLSPRNIEGENGRAGSEERPARHQPHRDNALWAGLTPES
jgi:hypothetical protein